MPLTGIPLLLWGLILRLRKSGTPSLKLNLQRQWTPMLYSYKTEQWLPYPVEDVFSFFASPENLPALMPGWQKARIEKLSIVSPSARPGSPDRIAAGVGTRLILSFRPLPLIPLRVRWEVEIEEFSWNAHFRDRQIRGPFAYWRHSHRLRAVIHQDFPITFVADHVEYQLPFGILGRLAHRLFLRRQIEQAFAYRHIQVADILARTKPQVRESQASTVRSA
jgi:ligand-binding SRPBCC domain-containing protein